MTGGLRSLGAISPALVIAALLAFAAPAGATLGVTWMKGYAAPGTPAKYISTTSSSAT